MNISDALKQPQKPLTFEDSKKQVVDSILKYGKVVDDKRLARRIIQSVGIVVTIPLSVAEELEEKSLLEKYHPDSERMSKTYDIAIKKGLEDPGSRQLLVLNTDDYENVQQCFQLMQFILDDGEYVAIVYQRSADTVKLKDDWIYFARTALMFSRSVNKKLKHISVHYGSIHLEIKD